MDDYKLKKKKNIFIIAYCISSENRSIYKKNGVVYTDAAKARIYWYGLKVRNGDYIEETSRQLNLNKEYFERVY